MLRPLQMAHAFLAEVVSKEDTVVDATMGNGHDTLFLAQLARQVYAFDIQEQAVEKTRQRLAEAGLDNVQLILVGHETLDQYTDHFKAAIFNLGYLPSADKSVITRPDTTLEALEKVCRGLEKGGRAAIMIYYGHELLNQMLQITIYRLIFDKNLGKIAVITNLSTKRNVHISRSRFGLHSKIIT